MATLRIIIGIPLLIVLAFSVPLAWFTGAVVLHSLLAWLVSFGNGWLLLLGGLAAWGWLWYTGRV